MDDLDMEDDPDFNPLDLGSDEDWIVNSQPDMNDLDANILCSSLMEQDFSSPVLNTNFSSHYHLCCCIFYNNCQTQYHLSQLLLSIKNKTFSYSAEWLHLHKIYIRLMCPIDVAFTPIIHYLLTINRKS